MVYKTNILFPLKEALEVFNVKNKSIEWEIRESSRTKIFMWFSLI